MRGVEAGLEGGLVGLLAEVGEEVAHALLAGMDDPSGWGLVDGVSGLLAEPVKALLELLTQAVGGELRLGIQGQLQQERGCGGHPTRNG